MLVNKPKLSFAPRASLRLSSTCEGKSALLWTKLFCTWTESGISLSCGWDGATTICGESSGAVVVFCGVNGRGLPLGDVVVGRKVGALLTVTKGPTVVTRVSSEMNKIMKIMTYWN